MGKINFLGWLMGGFLKPFYDMDEDVHHRSESLKIYFRDIKRATAGKISLERLAGSGLVLDVGMGRGALAILLRSLGMSGRIVGIDEERYGGITGYESYDRREFGPIDAVVAQGRLATEIFEHVVCLAPSEKILNWAIKSGHSVLMKPGGEIIVITELDVVVIDQFQMFQGSGGYKHYLFRKF